MFFNIYIYISVNLGRIFSLIHVQLNNIAILAFTSFFSSVSKYLILLLILQGKLLKFAQYCSNLTHGLTWSNHESNLSNIQNIRATPQGRQINSVIEQNLIRNHLIGTIGNDDTNTHTLRRSARLNLLNPSYFNFGFQEELTVLNNISSII